MMLRAYGSTDATVGGGKSRKPGGGRGNGNGKGPNGGGGGTDPYFANVRTLMHFDGTNGSTTFTDEIAGNSWAVALGSPTLATGTKKFGTASGSFDGTAGINMTTDNAVWDIDEFEDFTIEAWVYATDVTTTTYPCFITRQGNVNNMALQCRLNSAGAGRFPEIVVRAADGTSVQVLTHTTSVTINTWHHIAYCRASNFISVFLDGVKNASTIQWQFALTSLNAAPHIGVMDNPQDAPSGYWKGYIDEVRVTVGTARYTADFTPPTAAFPNS